MNLFFLGGGGGVGGGWRERHSIERKEEKTDVPSINIHR